MKVPPGVWLTAFLVVLADFFTKQWALAELEPGANRPILGDYLSLQLVRNSGAAFSLGENFTWVLTIVALAVTIGIVVMAVRAKGRLGVAVFGIALGGAVGNLIDRLTRDPGFGRGHVVDMINYNGYFVGNVADIAIVGAAAVFVVLSLSGRKLVRPAPGEQPAAKDAEASPAS